MTAELVLITISGDEIRSQKSFEMDEILTIGREPGNDIFINDNLISRYHALVRRNEGEYVILDLGSSNGTFVNNKPVSAPTPIGDNDEIKLGKARLIFRLKNEASAPAARQSSTQRVFSAVNMALLVSDVRNFTTLSETLPADKLSILLSEWFRAVGDLLVANNGNIEKIRGDSVLAYWLAEPGGAGNEHVVGALNTAIDMRTAARDFDKQMADAYPGSNFRIGCGIHMGEAVLGNIGADARRDYTTMGDCVNVTFRIESLCSLLNRTLLVSDDIREMAGDVYDFEDLGMHKVKGKPKPLHIFSIADDAG